MQLVALLDANVLWNSTLRDTLVRAQRAKIYRALWTREILDEFVTSLKRQRPDLDPGRIDRTRSLLLEEFPLSLVREFDDLIPSMLNDLGDRHVLAAAIRGGANTVVTLNVRHFPDYACHPHRIEVKTPDHFLCQLFESDQSKLTDVLKAQAAGLARPPMSPVELVGALGLVAPGFARMAQASHLLNDQMP